MTTVAPSQGTHTPRQTTPAEGGHTPSGNRQQPAEGYSRKETTPGDKPPSDFGHGREHRADANGDGTISDAEAKTYAADRRADTSRYQADSRERIAHHKEESKNYRSELEARTEQFKSKNDNKAHKMFGIQFGGDMTDPTKPK